jgi:probable addiction module antidote protein
MEQVTVADWDMAEVLDTKEDIISSLEVALAENNIKFLFDIIDALDRAEGMTQLSKELGVTREALYKSLSPAGSPSFETVLKLLDILGFCLSIRQKNAS